MTGHWDIAIVGAGMAGASLAAELGTRASVLLLGSKGAVFLVDRKTRSVIWSDYVRPKNAQPDELNHVADKIAGQLEKDKKGKKDQ